MPRTFTCQHCGKIIPRNPRLKKQNYCSSRTCQNARRMTTNITKAKTSKRSRSLRQSRTKRWREAYPAHEYQKQYRETHPDYVERNRELQKDRNNKREKEQSPMIVKTYALSPQPLRDGFYMGFEVNKGKIVKTYAYMDQWRAQHGLAAFSRINPD